MPWKKNITGLDAAGTFRSLKGAADENIFIGRASQAGFFCFFKVWRDMPYDAVLDYDGVLYRVEVKGSSSDSFNVTRGSRSGKQIVKGAGVSRTRLLDREDCDFVVCVDSNSGDCYIVPEDIVRVADRQNLNKTTLEPFKEKWELFMYDTGNLQSAGGIAVPSNGMKKEWTRDGFNGFTLSQLDQVIQSVNQSLGLSIPATNRLPSSITIPGTKQAISKAEDIAVYKIWTEIAKIF